MNRAPPYTIGAIGTKGRHIMNGYWKRGEEDVGAGIVGEWLVTNDLGYIDRNGSLYFCGRLNDVIRTGGETVFAPEVEKVLINHPNIDQCAVFALPDERLGECVCAAVVMKRNDNFLYNNKHKKMVVEDIRKFCGKYKLSGFKRPRRVFITNELPRNSAGKILKHLLKREYSVKSRL